MGKIIDATKNWPYAWAVAQPLYLDRQTGEFFSLDHRLQPEPAQNAIAAAYAAEYNPDGSRKARSR